MRAHVGWQKNPEKTEPDRLRKMISIKSLNENGKLAYRKKLTLESGEILPDPYSLKKDWIEDADILPEVSREDVTHYLIETPT